MYLTLAGIQRISSSSTNRIVALVRNRRIGDPDSHGRRGTGGEGREAFGSSAAEPSTGRVVPMGARWSCGGAPKVRSSAVAAATIERRTDAILGPMTAPTLDAEPACPGPVETAFPTDQPVPPPVHARAAVVRLDPARDLGTAGRPQPVGDAVLRVGLPSRLVGRLRRRTPTTQTLVVVPADAPDDGARPVAIVPLMHRHEVEPSDARPTRRCATAPTPT